MKKLSVFQISLLAAFCAFAVAGVLIFSFAISSNNATTLGPVKIWGTLDAAAFSAVLRQAAEADPSLAQVSYEQKDPTTYEDDLTKALAAGTGPDLFVVRQDYAFHDEQEIAAIPSSAISQSQFSDTFIEAANPFFSPQGALAIPLVTDPLVLYWNKDMLASASFSQPPQYWDQLFGMAQALSQKDSNDQLRRSAIAFGEFVNVDNAKDIIATLMLQAGVLITSYDTTGKLGAALIRGGAGESASDSALRFYTQFSDPSKDYYSWNRSLPSAKQQFMAGQLALYVGYASEAPSITRGNPNLNFGIAPMPQIRTAQYALDTAHVYALAASHAGRNPSAAITAAAALATATNDQALTVALGLPSARRDVLATAAQKQLPSSLVSPTDICKGVDPIICSTQMSRAWVDPDPSATDAIFKTMIEDTTSGAALSTEALSRADQQLTQLLSKQTAQ